MFQSTRPVRGATVSGVAATSENDVSIHAPRAGRDGSCGSRRRGDPRFQSTRPVRGATIQHLPLHHIVGVSIHAPRAGRDFQVWFGTLELEPFQSTRPVRGATAGGERLGGYYPGFNPRAPCGARRAERQAGADGGAVSIHAPRAGRDAVLPLVG